MSDAPSSRKEFDNPPGNDFGEVLPPQDIYESHVSAIRRLGAEIPARLIALAKSDDWIWANRHTIGAPFRCFDGECAWSLVFQNQQFQSNSSRQFELHIPLGPPGPTRTWLLIPYRPLPGLFYSWAFWSVLAYALLSALAYTRITRRLAKGLCPTCAYDLGGAPRCPECGTIVRTAPTPATLSP